MVDRRRWWRLLVEIAGQASAASVVTPDSADRAAPGTLAAPARRRPAGRGRPGGGRAAGRLPRLPGPALVIATLMMLIIGGLVFERLTGTAILPSVISAGIKPPPDRFPVMAASQPVGISIRALRLDAPVHEVGLADDGAIAAPSAERAQEAGWYNQSPTPGQYGPAVLVGHVDTQTGPAVFHDLSDLRSGEKIEVSRADGSIAVFEVNSISRYDKTRLPVDQLYEDFSRPGLRVITCGGRWVGGQVGYADNIVVFASLVTARDG
ncbi:class F sortase [Solwaraspora sp. WMMD1047]|uniref:class F sortase n=1 Tax=Solwaraspora sp. WMMD1047 TaxID=3016102 RepID=UPI002415AA26|nr:class F sortase [Solwaraspora sp. WMMD1047]MDG4829110.1 class F sortase [Solwaraspora sp. WMMD1047]